MGFRHFIRWGALLLFSVLFSVTVASCTQGRTAILGYVFDVTTATPLTNYQMQVDSPELDTQSISPNGSGMFSFTIKSNSDYIVRISQDGYRLFTSTNLRSIDKDVGTDDVIYRRVYMAALIPSKLSFPALTGNVVDVGDGSAVDGGFYRMVPTGIAAGFQAQVFTSGLDIAGNAVPRFWMPNGGAVAGPISKGSFTIPKDSLLPGYTYTIATVGVPGYQDQTTAFPAFSSATVDTVPQINIKLMKQAQPGAIALLAQSDLGPDGATPVPISSARQIVFTFDRPVTMDAKALKSVGSNILLGSVTGTDATGAPAAPALTLKTETVAGTAFSANVVVTSSGNTVTITLGPETALVNQTVDPKGDLSYTLSATLLGGIMLRDAAWAGSPWQALSGFAAVKNTVVIRHNFAP